ncbi:hypothetical protein EF910_02205 [Streptomyces sp. WAC07149]|uniref:hypothetical protein n=1 Tax=Streptomyces sp. WAC07149 TaxID=2487425 RepID=UPI000F790BBB|nr:hypothetical protein [Streptomyces sp. WAC07149]RST09038.1 hypothetical protein EF910_02205 [Streptomyces sp. WAC07149]
MRLRNAAVAAVGALTLLVTAPTSANAAVGEFLYTTGSALPAGLTDPTSGQCINLFGATEETPASAPKNLTNSTATVFLDFNCAGDTYYVMNPGRILGNRLKLRSVIFS